MEFLMEKMIAIFAVQTYVPKYKKYTNIDK